MRRHLLVLVAAASCLLPAAASAQTPAGDSVTGTLFDQFQTAVSVFQPLDVRSGPGGENPTGTAAWHVGGGLGPTWNVDVTCLSVDGKAAVFGFSGTLFFAGERMPVAGLARVTDGGGPGSGLDSFEWAQVSGPDGGQPIPGPSDCSSYPDGYQPQGPTAFNRTAGDIVVVDAHPLPVIKDQCKDGGWRNFAGFKNQGDCVSFLATKGMNHPSGRTG